MSIDIRMNDGALYRTEVADFDPTALEQKLNDTTLDMIAIGEVLVKRYAIERVYPTEMSSSTAPA